MIELYIENKKIELIEDLQVDFTYETINPDKLSTIKNSFSKTVSIPGTPRNNITFGHIFRIDKYIGVSGPTNIDNDYDPHKRVNWILNKNGILVNRGYCTLDNILVKDNRDITYQLTLYGGIGEFFYSLSYNADGTPKILADIFFNWYPKTNLIGHGTAMDAGQEATKVIMKCSADIIAQSYHELSPYYQYTGTTKVEQDVVFIPCYSGLYEDFDSKHMLVSTFNQTYNTSPKVLSDSNKSKLQTTFPNSLVDGETTYYAIGNNFSSSDAYRYGLVTFSRDIDPSEAGDFRVNELPIAIRLSKLMWALSNPVNNGGYDVIWDEDILTSYYWLYSWIILGKIKQDKEDIGVISISASETYDNYENLLTFSYTDNNSTSVTNCPEYSLDLSSTNLNAGTYSFNMSYEPHLLLNYISTNLGNDYLSTYLNEGKELISSSWYSVTVPNLGWRGFQMWNVEVIVNRIYNSTTLIKSIADVFFYTNGSSTFGKLEYNPYGKNPDALNKIKNKINSKLGITLDQIIVHNCNPKMSSKTYHNETIYGEYEHWYDYTFDCDTEKITTNFTVTSAVSSLNVKQNQYLMFEFCEWNMNSVNSYAGIYGEDTPTSSYNIAITKRGSFFSLYKSNQSSEWYGSINNVNGGSASNPKRNYYKFSFELNQNQQNGILTSKSSGFNIINLTKDLLFANADTPMKYLTDFCKILNLKFICDNTTKTVYIKTLKNYYDNIVYDINDKVDHNRDISMKPVVTSYKRINIGLETPDTYPVQLFNKINKDKFNLYKYDTNIEYNTTEQSLLNDSIFKNTIDWQQSSIFYNIYPQLPRPYDTVSVSWTLFDTANVGSDELSKKEFFTPGAPSLTSALMANTDFLPKAAMFDSSNKNVDIKNSLVFLNGFVKNYNYTLTDGATTTTMTPNTINESHYINSSGTVASSQYQDIYIYNITDTTLTYKVTCSFGSSYSSYAVNYYNSSGTRIGTQYTQSNSANYNDAVLTVPSGTTSIRCNFRKADTTKKLTVTTDNTYTISPNVIFTNDTVEQYYLNGSRCYMYDFKYNDNFVDWGCYSSDQKGSATSWVLPFFSKDLFNEYIYSTDIWMPSSYKLASWNINYQSSLESMYKLNNTRFVSNIEITFPKQISSTITIDSNEYVFGVFPVDSDNTRIYDTQWNAYMKDLYNRNTREVTLYVDLSKFDNPNEIMRHTYAWKGHNWIITKMFNYKISNIMNDRFTKVTMHKIVDNNAW